MATNGGSGPKGTPHVQGMAPHRLVLARVFDRLAEQEPDPEIKTQRKAEAQRMRELSGSQGIRRARVARERLS